MKATTTTIFLLFAVFAIAVSCGHNRLKTDEKKLGNQILTEEEQLAHEAQQLVEREKQLADSIAKLPKGFRFKEEREVDSEISPIEIDVVASRQNPKSIKLSQLFSKVDYITLEPLNDSTFYNRDSYFIINKNSLYGASSKGIAQYDWQGHFIKYICQNDLHFTKINGTEMTFENDFNQFVGGTQAKIVNGKLFYKFENRPKKFACLMEYDESNNQKTVSLTMPDVETGQSFITGLGKNVGSLQVRRFLTLPTNIYPLNSNCFADVASRKTIGNNHITLLYTNGDTLCSFPNYDKAPVYHKKVVSVSATGNNYNLNGVLYARESYNDTIFRIVPPNKLVPHIILNFGKNGITSPIQWMDPGYDLTGKLLLHDFLETPKYLFITYSKQISSQHRDIVFSRLIFDKASKTVISVYVDEVPQTFTNWLHEPYAPEIGVENDLNDKPFIWPNYATEQGVAYTFFTPEQFAEKLGISADLFFTNISNKSFIIAIYR